MKNLVIVESPSKTKNVQKYLGKDYKVVSCMGHICDLPDRNLSIDVKNGFKPTYVVPDDKKKLVAELKKEAAQADMVWLASDEDREGEAIAWHLQNVLKLEQGKKNRIAFHEITPDALTAAIANPREVDLNMVNAQQARRVLDRLVGYELSPVLWKKVKLGLSAGRVQSVTLRLVVEREREINDFKATSSYRVTAVFSAVDVQGKPCELHAELKRRFATEAEAHAFLEHCKTAKFHIESIEKRPTKKSPAAPFTTSTLQQEASRRLKMPVAQTMRVAQKLYEAGKITYMRTDSLNLSNLALGTIKKEVIEMAGENYVKVRQYHTKAKGAQEAHEAIRPTYVNNHTITGTANEQRLYELIWKRAVASQMADAEFEHTTININIDGSQEQFVATGEVMTFDGFLRVYMDTADDDADRDSTTRLPLIDKQDVGMIEASAQERFTQRPARYTDGTLVKKLEELGIGRPSTTASMITTILTRGYACTRDIPNTPHDYTVISLKKGEIKTEKLREKETVDQGKLSPTDVGVVVNDFLMEHFADILDYNFTANVEAEFDEIAQGKVAWNENIGEFYNSFHKEVLAADKTTGVKPGEQFLGNDPATGKPVYAKVGKYGVVAQLGSSDGDEKPRFADLQKGQSIFTITLEEALELFKLPMNLGKYEGEDMIVADGRFGPYIKLGKSFFSVPKTDNPYTLTPEHAIEIILAKREADKNRFIHVFGDIQVLNGPYGAYIHTVSDKKNYRLPKDTDAATLTEEACRAIIANPESASKGRRGSRRTTKSKK
jgi:DNA topoisomerase I